MRNPRRSRIRVNRGATVAELLVASILVGITLAVVGELMSLSVVANARLFNQFDAQTASNNSLDRVKRDIMGASRVLRYHRFNDTEFFADAQTLILELPVHYLHKKDDPSSPLFVAPVDPDADSQDAQSGVTVPGRYVVIYSVVPDIEAPGQFKLESRLDRDCEVLVENCSYREDRFEPQTIVKGIVGPLAADGQPGSLPFVFTYLAKNPNRQGNQRNLLERLKLSALTGVPSADGSETPADYAAFCVSCIGIDLELLRGVKSEQGGTNLSKHTSVHSETLLRLRHKRDTMIYQSAESQFGPAETQYYESN